MSCVGFAREILSYKKVIKRRDRNDALFGRG